MRNKTKLLLRYWLRRIFLWERWRVFVSVNGDRPIQLRMGHHKWHSDYCADPFLFRWNGENWLFYETLDKAGKGVLGCFKEVDGKWMQQGKVLELVCHLSYPQVFEEEGRVYMIPESFDCGNGEVALYEAMDFPYEWKKCATLIPGGYVDSTLLRKEGHYYLVCDRIYPKETAEVWHAASLLGPWVRHPESCNIAQSPRLRRCGGSFIYDNECLYRIAQDCNGAYGKRVYKVKIDAVSPTIYREGAAELLLGRDFEGKTLARHTYNMLQVGDRRIIAFDVRDYKLQSLWHMILETARILLGIINGVWKRCIRKICIVVK